MTPAAWKRGNGSAGAVHRKQSGTHTVSSSTSPATGGASAGPRDAWGGSPPRVAEILRFAQDDSGFAPAYRLGEFSVT